MTRRHVFVATALAIAVGALAPVPAQAGPLAFLVRPVRAEAVTVADLRPLADLPAGPEELLSAAQKAREAGDLARAEALYARAGEAPEALFWLGTVRRWSGNMTGAAEAFARLLAREPDHVDGLVGDAHVALRTGDLPRAERELARALALQPGYTEARDLLLTTYLREGRRGEAFALVERHFTGEERQRRMAAIAADARWYRRAARTYEALRTAHPDDPELALGLGRALEGMGYLDRAADVYADALRAYPEDAALRIRLATVYRWLGELDLAQRHYDQVLATQPNHPDALAGRAYLELARGHLSGQGTTTLLRMAPVAETAPAPVPAAAEEAPAPAPGAQVPEPPAEVPGEAAQAIGTAPESAPQAAVPEPPEAAPVAVAPAPPMTVRHTVRAGESLSRIAGTFLGDIERWPEVWEANPGIADPALIHPGATVVILVPAPGVRLVPHRVRPGDTLWRLARAYLGDAVLWPAVWRANPGIPNPDVIEPGQTVRVPVPMGELPAGAGLAVHTVRPGETLGTIASDYLGSSAMWKVVWRVNPGLADPNRIRPGQLLNVARRTPPVPTGPLFGPEPPPEPAAQPAPPAPPAPPTSAGAPPEAGPPSGEPSYILVREGWGAEQWARQLLARDPGSREARHLLARIDLRRFRFADAHTRLDALHKEDPADCAVCRDLATARAGLMPVAELGYAYENLRDLDGRADPLAGVPTPVRYKTRGWYASLAHRVRPKLAVTVRGDVTDSALEDLAAHTRIYDFEARTGWLEAARDLSPGHAVSLAGGLTGYTPNDGNSIADRHFWRLRLGWDRELAAAAWHVAAEQGPYLGRGIAQQSVFALFRERQLTARGERGLTPRSDLFARYRVADYQDGPSFQDAGIGGRLRLGTHRIEAELSQDHAPARFLDDAGGTLAPVFVRTRGARIEDRFAAPFPMRFLLSGRWTSYEAVTMTVGGTPQASPANHEVAARAEARYAHPALGPLAVGLEGSYERFARNAFAYNTVDQRGIGPFVELAGEPRCMTYRLRYGWGVWWDEDPANGHFDRQYLEGELRTNLGTHLAAGLTGRYGRANAFGEEAARVDGTLDWRF